MTVLKAAQALRLTNQPALIKDKSLDKCLLRPTVQPALSRSGDRRIGYREHHVTSQLRAIYLTQLFSRIFVNFVL